MKTKRNQSAADNAAQASKVSNSQKRSSKTFAHPEPRTPKEPNDDNIRSHAYMLYEKANCCNGHDIEHWVEATAQLKEQALGSWAHTR